MMTRDDLLVMVKEECDVKAATLSVEDIRLLVDLLDEKDDTVRYRAFLLLQRRSQETKDVYPYIDVFCNKLTSANSYQRSIGAMLVSANAAWDVDSRIDAAIGDYLALLHDEKPVTVHQSLHALVPIIERKPALRAVIADKLLAYDAMQAAETMRKSILLDVLAALKLLWRYGRSEEIRDYARKALSGGILDKKAARDNEDLVK